MPLPAEIAQIPVKRRIYLYRDGTAVAGQTITLDLDTEVSVGDTTLVPKRITVTLDSNGQVPADLTLPSTNDPDASLTGLAYAVTERWEDGRSGRLIVAYDAAEVDLADLVDYEPSAEYTAAIGAALSASAAAASASASAASAVAAADSATNASASATTATSQANASAASAVAADASEAAASASASAAATAQTAAETARDAAAVNADVYDNTTDGLAGTSEGEQFQVIDGDEIVRYRHDSGLTATEVARYPASAAVTAVKDDLLGAAENGHYAETFRDNDPITVTNLTDAATPSQTYTYGASGLTIALATGSRAIKYSTLNTVGGKKSRITLTQVVNTGASPGVGFAIGSEAFWYLSIGRVINKTGAALTTTAPTFSAPVTITTVIEIDDAGNMVATWTHAGGSVSISQTGVSMGDFALVQYGVSNTTHSMQIEAIGEYQQAVIDAAAEPELTAEDALAVKALTGLLAQLARTVPDAITTPVPYDFAAYKLSGVREFFTNIDLRPPLSESGSGVTVVYVDPVAGLDTNAGTESAPYKSLKKAVAVSAAKLIVKAKPGLYDKDTAWASGAPAATVLQVVPWGDGDIVSSMHYAGLSWSLVSGATYSATITTAIDVADASNLNADGDYTPLTSVASQAAVDAAPGSYYVTGTTIYLQTFDGRAPDSDVRVYQNLKNGFANKDGLTLYMEDVKFEGGDATAGAFATTLGVSTYSGTVLAKRCSFKYAAFNGMSINGHWLVILQDCIAAENKADGFNYHAIFGSDGPDMIEVDCIGRWNGRNASGTNNGSTMHDATSLGIRVGGDYHHNADRNVHDIGGAQSWNLGCTARDSQTVSRSNFCAGLSSDGATVTKMVLDTCTSSGSTYDLEATGGKGTIYTFDLVSDGSNVPGADVQAYQA